MYIYSIITISIALALLAMYIAMPIKNNVILIISSMFLILSIIILTFYMRETPSFYPYDIFHQDEILIAKR